MLFPLRDENRSRTFPFLTLLLILINTLVFLYTTYGEGLVKSVERFGFTPEALLVRPKVVVTSMFLHANLFHLISNLWFLWIFGDNIEDSFGRLRFLFLYIVSGVFGNLLNAGFTDFDSAIPVIGASGAVAGVMGSYVVKFPFARVRTLFLLIFYPIILRIPALILLGFWMAAEFIAAGLAAPNDFVAHWAHVGGFLFGVLWTWGRRDRYFRARGWWW